MDRRVVLEVLRRSDTLGALNEAFLSDLSALAASVRYPTGAWVFRRGDPPDALYVVSTGRLRVVAPSPGADDITLATLGPGSIFGEIALLDGRPRSAGVVVTADCVLLRIERAPFMAMVCARPDLAMALIQALAGRVRQLSRDVEEGASLAGRGRLARHLLRLARMSGRSDGEHITIDEHLPQAVLASSLGLSRQTVNRLLQELQSEGLILVRRARITVVDIVRLQKE